MKLSLFAVLIVSLVSLSCKKEQPDLSDQIIGKWELREVYSYRSGRVTYPPGNGNKIDFSRTNYTHYYPNSPTQSGTYRLVKDTSRIYGEVRDFILYNNSTLTIEMVSIEGDKLDFSIDAADGGGYQYERIH